MPGLGHCDGNSVASVHYSRILKTSEMIQRRAKRLNSMGKYALYSKRFQEFNSLGLSK